MIALEHINQIILPDSNWQEVLKHCKRKLEGNYQPGESRVRRAYGLIAGIQDEYTLKVKRILTLKKNLRGEEPYKTYMDGIMERHAVPSKTPLSGRGWISDPTELKEYFDRCDKDKLLVFGTYHMHVVPWEHDPKRDTPTSLDTILARSSNLFSFIVSMVDVTCPGIRAFYEGLREKEVHILWKS
jgi:hypothetical protein